MEQPINKKSNKRVKVNIIAGIVLIAVVALAIASVGVFFGNRKRGPENVISPIEWNTDEWNGQQPDQNTFAEGKSFANRGEKTYTINSADAFVAFVNLVNDAEKAQEYDYFKDYTIYLNKNINLANHEIESIGVQLEDGNSTFQGCFDGGYYSIINANLKGGLFAYVQNATIKNLGIYNATINSNLSVAGAVANVAKNSNIENVFVRLGAVNGKTIAGLVGNFVVTENDHYIKNSFVDSALSGNSVFGIVAKAEGIAEQDLAFSVEYCYFTAGERAIGNKENVIVTNAQVLKNPSINAFANWNYKSTYGVAEWCNFSAVNSGFSFNLPILSAFNKVFLVGAFYENVVVDEITGQTLNASSLPNALDSLSNGAVAELNIIVPHVYLDQTAVLSASANLTINSEVETVLTRGSSNSSSLIVASANSSLVLGGEDSAPIIIDGNSAYVQQNGAKSGAAVVAMGADFEMRNTTIVNNINNVDGFGGGLFVYDVHPADNSAVELSGTIENCQAKNGGGLAVVGASVKLGVNVSNCHAQGNGGGVYVVAAKENVVENNPALASTIKQFQGKKISLVDRGEYPDGELVDLSSEVSLNFTNNSAENGGGVYADGCSIKFRETSDDYLDIVCADNEVNNKGGGFYFMNCAWSGYFTNLNSYYNTAAYGGGMYIGFGMSDSGSNPETGITNFTSDSADFQQYLTLTALSLHNNSANYGGGLAYEFIPNDSGNGEEVYFIPLTIQASAINNNFASLGGGVYIKNYATYENYEDLSSTLKNETTNCRFQASFINSVISHNTASVGGGVYSATNNIFGEDASEETNNLASCYSGIYFISSSDAQLSPNEHYVTEVVENYASNAGAGVFATKFGEIIFSGENREDGQTDIRSNKIGLEATELIKQENMEGFEHSDMSDLSASCEDVSNLQIAGAGLCLVGNRYVTFDYANVHLNSGVDETLGGGMYVASYKDENDNIYRTSLNERLDHNNNDQSVTPQNLNLNLDQNTAHQGGGAYFDNVVDFKLTLNTLMMTRNNAEAEGGGMYFSGWSGDFGDNPNQQSSGTFSSSRIYENYRDSSGMRTHNNTYGFATKRVECYYRSVENDGVLTYSEYIEFLDYPNVLGLETNEPLGVNFLGWSTERLNGTVLYDTITDYHWDNYNDTSTLTLYASYDKQFADFNVTFDINADEYQYPNDSFKTVVVPQVLGGQYVLPELPDWDGWTFAGWWTVSEYSYLDDGQRVLESTIVRETDATTLYAQWEPKSLEVRVGSNAEGVFVMSGGPGGKPAQIGTDGLTNFISLNASFTYEETPREGYLRSFSKFEIYEGQDNTGALIKTFLASECQQQENGQWSTGFWTISEDLGKYYPSIFIYAVWDETPIEYTLTYSLDGGSEGSLAPKTAQFDQVLEISNPVKKGYKFTGWTAENLTTTTALHASSSAGLSSASAWTGTAQTTDTFFKNLRSSSGLVTLTAHWQATSYTVAFAGNVSLSEVTAEYDKEIKLDIPTRKGYNFTGWSSNAAAGLDVTSAMTNSASATALTAWNGTTKIFTSFKNLNSTEGKVTLTANWEQKSVQVTLNANGGTIQGKESIVVTETPELQYTNLTTSPDPREGYDFIGWFGGKDNGEMYDNSSIVANPNPHTLWAHWQAKTYDITVEGINATVTAPENASTGTFGEPLTISWAKNIPTGFSEGSLSVKIYLGEADTTGTVLATTGSSVVYTMKTTYYSKVRIVVEYKTDAKTFNVHDVSKTEDLGHMTSATTGTVGQALTITWASENLVGYSYTFVSATVYSDEGLKNQLATTASASAQNLQYTMSGSYYPDIYVVIKYTKTANSYNIAYSGTEKAEGFSGPSTAKFDDVVTIPTPTRTGYNFTGWSSSTTANLETAYACYGSTASAVETSWNGGKVNVQFFKNLTSKQGTTVTLTANWEAIQYTVAFDGEDVDMENVTASYDAEVKITNPTRDGYTFAGWTSNSVAGLMDGALQNLNGGFEEYDGSASTSTTFKNLRSQTGVVTLTATWTAKKYVLSYSAVNGKFTAPASSGLEFDYDQNVTLTYSANNKVGYTYSTATIKVYAGNSASGEVLQTLSGGTSKTFNLKSLNKGYKVNIFLALSYDETANTYTVNYNYAGGQLADGASEITGATFDESFKISAPVRTGYKFIGWTASGLNTQTAKHGATSSPATAWAKETDKVTDEYFLNLTDKNKATVELTANWEQETYNITLKGVNATITSPTSATAKFDEEITISWTPNSKTGYEYTFVSVEIFYNATGTGNSYKLTKDSASNSASYTMNESTGFHQDVCIVVTYSESALTYNVTSKAENATISVASSGVYNQDLAISWAAENTPGFNYINVVVNIYGGTDETGTLIKTYTTGNSATFNMETENKGYFENIYISVKYVKDEVTYSITYQDSDNVAEPTVFTGPASAIFGQELTINNPTKTGYTFLGWTATGTMASARTHNVSTEWQEWDGNTKTKDIYFKDLRSEAGEVVLTANWQANEYNIIINRDNGTTNETKKATYYVDVVIDNPTKEGYTFLGWISNASAGLNLTTAQTSPTNSDWSSWDGKATQNTHFMNLSPIAGADVTLTAQWQVKTYNIRTAGQFGTITAPASANYNEAISVSWQDEDAPGYRYDLVNVSVYEDVSGEGEPVGQPIFTFQFQGQANGQFNMSSLGEYYQNILIYVSYNKTAVRYIVDITVNYSTTKTTRTINATFDEPIKIEAPKVSGYTFTGWTSSIEDGLESLARTSPTGTGGWTPWDGSSSLNEFFMNLRNSDDAKVVLTTTLQAKGYSINYEEHNGEFSSPEKNSVHLYNEDVILNFHNNNRTGYTYSATAVVRAYVGTAINEGNLITIFNGSSKITFNLENLKETLISKFDEAYFENIYFELQYIETAISYNIDYNLADGTVQNAPKSAYYDQSISIPNATKEGYNFVGWVAQNLNPETAKISETGDVWADWDGTSTNYTNFKNLASVQDTVVVLTAVFSAKTFSIATTGINGSILQPTEEDFGSFDVALAIVWQPEGEMGFAYTFKSLIIYGIEGEDKVAIATYNTEPKSPLNFKMCDAENSKYYNSILIEIVYDKDYAPRTLTANANGGQILATPGWTISLNGTIATKPLGYDKPYGNLPEVERLGYVFIGWFNDASAGEEVDSDTLIIDDVTIFAHWLKDIAFLNISYAKTATYTGSAIEPTVTILDDSTQLEKGEDFEVDYANNVNVADSPTITIKGIGNYRGTKVLTFAITPKDISSTDISIASVVLTYDGNAKTPNLTITDTKRNELLVLLKDYSVNYSNNTNATENALATISGVGNYSGTREFNFTIEPRDISSAMVELSDSSFVYNGKNQVPNITVKLNEVIIPETDYTISFKLNSNSINKEDIKEVGTYTIVITGQVNAKGVNDSATFAILSLSLNNADVKLNSSTFTFNGREQQPAIESVKIGTLLLTEGDYLTEVHKTSTALDESVSPINADNYYLVLKPNASFLDGAIKSIAFTINALDIKNANILVANLSAKTYNGNEQKPVVEITYSYSYGEKQTFQYTLQEGENLDYVLSYSREDGKGNENFTDAGTITYSITGKNNFINTRTEKYLINPKNLNEPDIVVSKIADETYNRNQHTPALTILDGEKQLVAEEDYTLTYSQNTEVGQAVVTISGTGNYTGTRTANFEILEAEITSVALKQNSNLFDRLSHKDKIVIDNVMAGSLTLTADDYVVDYKRNASSTNDFINSGSITVVVTGQGNFKGSASAVYEIQKVNVDDVVLSNAEFVYNRKTQIPTLTVKAGELILLNEAENNEYTILYSRNGENTDNLTDAGTIGISISLTELGQKNFICNITSSYKINSKNIENEDVLKSYYIGKWNEDGSFNFNDRVALNSYQVYVGQKVFPILEFDGIELVYNFSNNANNEYNFEIQNPTSHEIADNFENVGFYDVVVSGQGNYTGKITRSYQVNPAELTDKNVKITLLDSNFVYNGEPYCIDPSRIKVEWTDDKTNKTYQLGYTANPDLVEDNGRNEDTAEIKNGWTFFNGNYEYDAEHHYTINVKNGFVNNENAGTAMIYIQGVKNLFGVVTTNFVIDKAELKQTDLSITLDNESYVFDGEPKQPEPTVVWNISSSKTLTLQKGVDYLVEYENNTNAGRAKVILKNVDAVEENRNNITFNEEIYKEFEISAFNINSGKNKIYVNNEQSYSASLEYDLDRETPLHLSISFKPNEGKTINLELGKDYSLSYFRGENETIDFNSVGTITIKIAGKNNFVDTLEFNYTITQLAISSASLQTDSVVFNGENQFNQIQITILDKYNRQVADIYNLFNIKYFVDESEVLNKTFVNCSTVTIEISLLENSNYKIENSTGILTLTFTINPLSLQEAFASEDLVAIIADQEFKDSQLKPEFSSLTYKGVPLTDKDYQISAYGENKNQCTKEEQYAFVEIEGKGNFSNKLKVYFAIVGIDLGNTTDHEIKIDGVNFEDGKTYKTFVFDNAAHQYKPEIVVDGIVVAEDALTFSYYVKVEENYLLATNFVNVNEFKVEIQGKGNYGGKLTIFYSIIAKNFADEDVVIALTVGEYQYTGAEIKPEINSATISYSGVSNLTINFEQDFAIAYFNNTAVGTAQIAISGLGNFEGSYSNKFTFAITKRVLNAEDDLLNFELENYVYSGKEISPEINIKYNNIPLIVGEDYQVSITPNVILNARTYAVTIEGIGNNFTGSFTKTFDVTPVDIANAFGFESLFNENEYTYSGDDVLELIKLNLKYTLQTGTVSLVEKQDYSIETLSENFVNVGSYSLLLKGNNNYFGELTINFEIVAVSFGDGNLNSSLFEVVYPDYTFNNQEMHPEKDIVVKYNGKTLTEGEDYFIEITPTPVKDAKNYNVKITPASENFVGEANVENAFEVKPQVLHFDVTLKEEYFEGDLLSNIETKLQVPDYVTSVGRVTLDGASSGATLTRDANGKATLSWTFTPNSENYASCSGEITIDVLAVLAEVIDVQLSNGQTRLDYSAYDEFVSSEIQLTVTITYNNGTTKVVNGLNNENLSYKFNVELENNLLIVDANKLIVSYTENNTELSAFVPVKVNPISVSLQFKNPADANSIVVGQDVASKFKVIAVENKNNDKLKYLTYNIVFENENGATAIENAGDYTAKLNFVNNNFVVANGTIEFYARATSLKAVEFGSIVAKSDGGFDKGVTLHVNLITNQNEIKECLGENYSKLSRIEYLIQISFEGGQVPTNYAIYFKQSEYANYRSFAIDGDLLLDLTNEANADGYVQLFANTTGVMVLCGINAETNNGIRWLIFFIILLILFIIFILFLIQRFVTKHKRKKMVDELNENVTAKA